MADLHVSMRALETDPQDFDPHTEHSNSDSMSSFTIFEAFMIFISQ
jgi:hypothetical protein